MEHRTHLEPIPIHILSIRAPRVVCRGRNSGGRVPKHSSPLLDGLVIVLNVKRLVGAAVVDLHLGTCTGITRVHVLNDVCPLLLGPDGLTRGAGRVPEVRGVVNAHEAACRNAGVGDARCEDVGVCRGQDVLCVVSTMEYSRYPNWPCRHTVIIAPEDIPVANTRLRSAPYCVATKSTMFAIELLAPPPPCVSVILLATSQQLSRVYGVCG